MFAASPVHFPAEVLEEGGEPGLAGGLAAARPPGQHQLVDAASGGHGVFDFEVLHCYLLCYTITWKRCLYCLFCLMSVFSFLS